MDMDDAWEGITCLTRSQCQIIKSSLEIILQQTIYTKELMIYCNAKSNNSYADLQLNDINRLIEYITSQKETMIPWNLRENTHEG